MPADSAPVHRGRRFYIGIALVLASAIGFSGKAVLVKLIYRYAVDPDTLLALRMLLAFPFFFAMAAWSAVRAGHRLDRREWLTVIYLGFIGYYLSSYLDLLGLQYVPAGLARLILYLHPTMVIALSAALYKQRVQPRQVFSLLVCYAGIVLVFVEQASFARAVSDLVAGGALIFAGALLYAVYLICSAEVIGRLGALRLTAYASTIACVLAVAHFAALREVRALIVPEPVYVLGIVLAVFSTVLPVWLMGEGLRRIGANQAVMVSSAGPVSTIVLGFIFLGEPITLLQSLGAALVLAGVVLVSLKPRA